MLWFTKLIGFVGGKTNAFLYIGIALVVGVAFTYVAILKSDNKELRSEKSELLEALAVTSDKLNNALEVNEQNVQEFNDLMDSTNKTYEAMAIAHKQEIKRAVAFTKKLEEIKYAKKTNDDGVAANVLVDAFNWMHQRQTTTATSDNEDKSSKAEDTK